MRTPPITAQVLNDIDVRSPDWPRRVRARLIASRLDRDLDAGLPVVAGTVRAAHADRIISLSERHRLSCGLRTALDRAHRRDTGVSLRIPLQYKKILADAALIGQILQRLDATQPVRPRGMARLRLLLGDGLGPLYTSGTGSLAEQLRGVIAAL
jgi:hypothetical protein